MRRTFLKTALVAAIATAATAMTGNAMAADLTVGANIGNVPWEFQDATGKNVGFEIDLVDEIAKRLGKSVEIVNIPFNGLFSAVQSARIDMAISSITITEKRLESVSFAQPYYDSDQSLTVLSKSGIAKVEDLKGKAIGVDTGSTGDMWATQNQAQYGFGDIRRFEGLQPAMLDLAAGRLDGYVSDIPALLYFTKDKPQFKVAQRIQTGERYSIMFAKDSPLATQVNEQITAMKKDGTVAALHEKWFGAKPEAGTSTAEVMDMPKPKS